MQTTSHGTQPLPFMSSPEMELDFLLNKVMTVKFDWLNEVTDKRIKDTFDKAVELVGAIINDPEFRKGILNFKNSDGEYQFRQTDQPNLWHLKQFVEANERDLGPFPDYEMDYQCKLYYKGFSRVTAYTNRGSLIINFNQKYLYRSIPSIVETLVHEYCHLVRMEHSYKNPGWHIWNETAPYAIGIMANKMASKLLGIDESDVVPVVRKRRWWRRVWNWMRRKF